MPRAVYIQLNQQEQLTQSLKAQWAQIKARIVEHQSLTKPVSLVGASLLAMDSFIHPYCEMIYSSLEGTYTFLCQQFAQIEGELVKKAPNWTTVTDTLGTLQTTYQKMPIGQLMRVRNKLKLGCHPETVVSKQLQANETGKLHLLFFDDPSKQNNTAADCTLLVDQYIDHRRIWDNITLIAQLASACPPFHDVSEFEPDNTKHRNRYQNAVAPASQLFSQTIAHLEKDMSADEGIFILDEQLVPLVNIALEQNIFTHLAEILKNPVIQNLGKPSSSFAKEWNGALETVLEYYHILPSKQAIELYFLLINIATDLPEHDEKDASEALTIATRNLVEWCQQLLLQQKTFALLLQKFDTKKLNVPKTVILMASSYTDIPDDTGRKQYFSALQLFSAFLQSCPQDKVESIETIRLHLQHLINIVQPRATATRERDKDKAAIQPAASHPHFTVPLVNGYSGDKTPPHPFRNLDRSLTATPRGVHDMSTKPSKQQAANAKHHATPPPSDKAAQQVESKTRLDVSPARPSAASRIPPHQRWGNVLKMLRDTLGARLDLGSHRDDVSKNKDKIFSGIVCKAKITPREATITKCEDYKKIGDFLFDTNLQELLVTDDRPAAIALLDRLCDQTSHSKVALLLTDEGAFKSFNDAFAQLKKIYDAQGQVKFLDIQTFCDKQALQQQKDGGRLFELIKQATLSNVGIEALPDKAKNRYKETLAALMDQIAQWQSSGASDKKVMAEFIHSALSDLIAQKNGQEIPIEIHERINRIDPVIQESELPEPVKKQWGFCAHAIKDTLHNVPLEQQKAYLAELTGMEACISAFVNDPSKLGPRSGEAKTVSDGLARLYQICTPAYTAGCLKRYVQQNPGAANSITEYGPLFEWPMVCTMVQGKQSVRYSQAVDKARAVLSDTQRSDERRLQSAQATPLLAEQVETIRKITLGDVSVAVTVDEKDAGEKAKLQNPQDATAALGKDATLAASQSQLGLQPPAAKRSALGLDFSSDDAAERKLSGDNGARSPVPPTHPQPDLRTQIVQARQHLLAGIQSLLDTKDQFKEKGYTPETHPLWQGAYKSALAVIQLEAIMADGEWFGRIQNNPPPALQAWLAQVSQDGSILHPASLDQHTVAARNGKVVELIHNNGFSDALTAELIQATAPDDMEQRLLRAQRLPEEERRRITQYAANAKAATPNARTHETLDTVVNNLCPKPEKSWWSRWLLLIPVALLALWWWLRGGKKEVPTNINITNNVVAGTEPSQVKSETLNNTQGKSMTPADQLQIDADRQAQEDARNAQAEADRKANELQRQKEAADARAAALQQAFKAKLQSQQEAENKRKSELATRRQTELNQPVAPTLQAEEQSQSDNAANRTRYLADAHQAELDQLAKDKQARLAALQKVHSEALARPEAAGIQDELQSKHQQEIDALGRLETLHLAAVQNRHKKENEAQQKLENSHQPALKGRRDTAKRAEDARKAKEAADLKIQQEEERKAKELQRQNEAADARQHLLTATLAAALLSQQPAETARRNDLATKRQTELSQPVAPTLQAEEQSQSDNAANRTRYLADAHQAELDQLAKDQKARMEQLVAEHKAELKRPEAAGIQDELRKRHAAEISALVGFETAHRQAIEARHGKENDAQQQLENDHQPALQRRREDAKRAEDERKRREEEADAKRKADEKAEADRKAKEKQEEAERLALERQTAAEKARLLQLQKEREAELARQQKDANARQLTLDTTLKAALSQAKGEGIEAELARQQKDADARQKDLDEKQQAEMKRFQETAAKRKLDLETKQTAELQGAEGEHLAELNRRHTLENSSLQKAEDAHKAELEYRHQEEKDNLKKAEDEHKAKLQHRKDEADKKQRAEEAEAKRKAKEKEEAAEAERKKKEAELKRQKEAADARADALKEALAAKLQSQQNAETKRKGALETARQTELNQPEAADLQAELKRRQEAKAKRQNDLAAAHKAELDQLANDQKARLEQLEKAHRAELARPEAAGIQDELKQRHKAEKEALQQLETAHRKEIEERHGKERAALQQFEKEIGIIQSRKDGERAVADKRKADEKAKADKDAAAATKDAKLKAEEKARIEELSRQAAAKQQLSDKAREDLIEKLNITQDIRVIIENVSKLGKTDRSEILREAAFKLAKAQAAATGANFSYELIMQLIVHMQKKQPAAGATAGTKQAQQISRFIAAAKL